MNIESNVSDFASWIGAMIRCELEETEHDYIYTPRFSRDKDIQFTLPKEELANEVSLLDGFSFSSEIVMSTDRTYEILVREEGPFIRFSRFNISENTILEIEDMENNLTYSLGSPSNQFVLFLIKNSVSRGEAKALIRNSSSSMKLMEQGLPILEYLKKSIAGRMTLKVSSSSRKSLNDFDKFSSAFLFNITYNTDTALVQQRDFDELLRTGRITKNRRSNINEIDPPRRTYVPDLIHHYQLAVSTENPMLEYISYYHIIEHFLESIFLEALEEQVRSRLTHPDFSYKRKRDIFSLIKDITKSVALRDENMTIKEQEGVYLTLKKHLDINELVEKLNEYDASLVEYYKLNAVSFSKANTVHLEGGDDEVIYKNLAARIYKNRNSIVHSKESEKAKYTPFRDDKILVKEVPLLRFISEQIIFETSTVA